MISTLIMANLMLTIMFIMMKHPLSTGAILLMQTIVITMISGNLYQNFWFSYILFLVMIGGMLILFMYMTSIASNEKFKTNYKFFMITPIPILIILNNKTSKNILSTGEMNEISNMNMMESTLSKFINFPMSTMMLFLMIYLFLTMMASVKISLFEQGSIRQMN